MDIMKFINENYVWFIVGGVILLMALIGYVAERTDFGRKEATKKEKKIKDDETRLRSGVVPVTEPLVAAPVIPDADNLVLGQDTSLMEDINVPLNGLEENNLQINEDLNVPLETPINDMPQADLVVDEDLTAPLVPTSEVFSPVEEAPLSDINVDSTNNYDANAINSNAGDIYQNKPINDVFGEGPVAVEEVIEEEPNNELKETPINEDIPVNDKKANIDLPNIDTLKDNDTEEDVWKF